MRPAAQGKEGVGQRLVVGARSTKGAAGHHPHRGDRQQERAPVIPAQAVAPADISQPGEPPSPTTLGISRRDPSAVERRRDPTLGCQEGDEMPHNGHQRSVMLPHLAMVLLPQGQRWKGGPQVALRLAVKATFTAKTLPLAKDGQGSHLTPTKGSL